MTHPITQDTEAERPGVVWPYAPAERGALTITVIAALNIGALLALIVTLVLAISQRW